MNFIEFSVVLFLCLVGYAGAESMGRTAGWYGYIAGPFVAWGALTCLVTILLWIEKLWRVGRPPYPPCKNRRCTQPDYRYAMEGDKLCLRCACGDQYEKNGRVFFFVNPAGEKEIYLTWKPFSGWYSPSGEKIS